MGSRLSETFCFYLASFSLVFCRVYFLSPFQLLWCLGRSQFKHTSNEQDHSQSEAKTRPSSFSYWFRPRYDPTMSVSLVTGERREMMRLRRKFVFTRAAPGAPVRPRKMISCTLKYFGRSNILEVCNVCCI